MAFNRVISGINVLKPSKDAELNDLHEELFIAAPAISVELH